MACRISNSANNSGVPTPDRPSAKPGRLAPATSWFTISRRAFSSVCASSAVAITASTRSAEWPRIPGPCFARPAAASWPPAPSIAARSTAAGTNRKPARAGADPFPAPSAQSTARLPIGVSPVTCVIERQSESGLAHLRSRAHQQIELAPAHRFPLPFPSQQTKPLASQEQPRMIGIDAVFVLAE